MGASSNADQEMSDMLGRRKNRAEEAQNRSEGALGEAGRPAGPDSEMPLDVPSREPSPAQPSMPVRTPRARPPGRVAPPQAEPVRRLAPGTDNESKRLVVGRSIALSGRIESCERLVVEGAVETEMIGCRELEITGTGVFKGNAEVETAEISGRIEGALTARRILTVRASGRVRGSISYGQLEVEPGGTIIGDVQPLSDGDSREAAPQLAAGSPAG